MMSLGFTAISVMAFLPDHMRRQIGDALGAIGGTRIMLGAALVIIGLQAILLSIAAVRFRRTRLILD